MLLLFKRRFTFLNLDLSRQEIQALDARSQLTSAQTRIIHLLGLGTQDFEPKFFFSFDHSMYGISQKKCTDIYVICVAAPSEEISEI